MTSNVCGHEVERVWVGQGDLQYECVECGIKGVHIASFERYNCEKHAEPRQQ